MRAYNKAVAAYLGKHMKEKRDELGDNQEVMANKLGISSRMYGNYERGETVCPADVFLVFMNHFPQTDWIEFYDGFCEMLKDWTEEQEQKTSLVEEEDIAQRKARRKKWKCQD